MTRESLMRPLSKWRGPRVLAVDVPGRVNVVADVLRALADHGARLCVTGRGLGDGRFGALPPDLADRTGVTVASLPMRSSPDEHAAVVVLRSLSTAVWSFDPQRHWAYAVQTRSLKKLWKRLGAFPPVRESLWEDFAALSARVPELAAAAAANPETHAAFRALLLTLERVLPPPADLVASMRRLHPDVVFIVSRCSHGGPEPDLIKAARMIGVPSVLQVWSWDNLSSKAALAEHPDRIVVWNDVMADEAVSLHGIPKDRVHVAGAANFDPFFREIETLGTPTHDELLYLGSSTNVVPDELPVFRRWLEAVRADPGLASVPLAVRPHPSTPLARCAEWKADLERDGNARFSFARGTSPASDLVRAFAAAAINTSAEIEAAIAGVPVHTFPAGDEAPGQGGSVHYGYLLSHSGGFVEEATSLEDHVARIDASRRTTGGAAERRAAVGRFVRPLGLERAVAPDVAAAVLELVDRSRRR